MKTDKQTIYRQGDVLLIRIARKPKGAVEQKIDGDRIILAHGEATGHHHSVAKKDARLFTEPGTQATLLEVAEALTMLEHQEHSAIPLAKGVYEVRRQREYHPEEIRNVAD